MTPLTRLFPPTKSLLLFSLLLSFNLSEAQEENAPGQSIGQVSTQGDLIVLELNERALGSANLFNLAGHTLHFLPKGSRYRIENSPLQWDADFGPEVGATNVALHQFTFPFSGQRWNSFLVGTTGSISFGAPQKAAVPNPYGLSDAGISLDRFEQLADVAARLIDRAPAICVFLKPRLSGRHYVKELPDRVVITWDLTEPFGSLLDFAWFQTVNRFQAVLHRDGEIEMSYQELAARDAIVGIYPALSREEKPLATITSEPHPQLASYLDVQETRLSALDSTLLKVTFATRGPVPAEGNPAMEGIEYRIHFNAPESHSGPTAAWIIQGMKDRYNPTGGPAKYFVSGPGVFSKATISGNSITIEGILPAVLAALDRVAISVEVLKGVDHPSIVEQLPPHVVRLSGIRSPEVHFSSLARKDGPFRVAYESFHYLALPRPQDLSCTIIKALGDKFDFLVYYSDFRVDSQEASSPSEGPAAGNVTGIGQTEHDLDVYCSQGKFQWAFAQPVYVGANEMREQPPAGAPVKSKYDLTFYIQQLSAASAEGKPLPYNYAMSHIGHEMGHRWAAYVSAKINGQTISLGPWPHWLPTLQAQVAFPYQRPIEASTMGGGVWQDNLDGTYTQLHDGYFVPATGYSYLDLYLMGFISAAEVPDFFILKNLVPVERDANGHRIFKAERIKVTIQDVIAAEGARSPDVDHSQRKFNTGIVVIVEHGHSLGRELIERANGIRQQWIEFWQTATGHRSSMAVNPH